MEKKPSRTNYEHAYGEPEIRNICKVNKTGYGLSLQDTHVYMYVGMNKILTFSSFLLLQDKRYCHVIISKTNMYIQHCNL